MCIGKYVCLKQFLSCLKLFHIMRRDPKVLYILYVISLVKNINSFHCLKDMQRILRYDA